MRLTMISGAILLAVLACHSVDGPGKVDAGGSGDTDADADVDGDADADSDSDAECNPCELNSGFPCHCDTDPCEDGSLCARFGPDDIWGMCLPTCDHSTDCVPPLPHLGCGATRTCNLESGGTFYCTLTCDEDVDCPPGLTCESPFGAPMCYGGTGL